MKKRFSVVVLLIALFGVACAAGIRSAGKYSGVVIFDRWGGCTLYSGVYVMYVSEAVKEQLRTVAGKCVEIDATKVYQPINPGDGLIQKLTAIGPAPPANNWEPTGDLKLSIERAFDDGGVPEFNIRVENTGDKPTLLWLDALAPTLLTKKSKDVRAFFDPSDGPSTVVITRESFWVGDEQPRVNLGNETWKGTVTKPAKLERRDMTLDAKGTFEIRVALKLPEGEYEFLAGYGGGTHATQCVASNLVSFDVKKDGTAAVIKGKTPTTTQP